jgi:AcrR family transcriptional regulator
MLSGHQEGIRESAGGNCAYIAQSYGASIYENEIAEMQRTRCREAASTAPPRKLLLDAARDLFARQDYRSTTTREIAVAAGVTEHLLFRNFGSKAALFREALVLPFTSFIDEFSRTWRLVIPEETDEEQLARQFAVHLDDVFFENRGLVVTLLTSDGLSDEEMVDAGIPDIRRAFTVLGQISAEGMQLRGMRSQHPDLVAYSMVAMIAGMATMRLTQFGDVQPSREAIVSELTQATLHGFLHRND